MSLPFEQMFEDAPFAASLSRRADGRLVAVNQAWEALSGIARDQAIGRTTVELGLWTDATQREAYLDSLKEQDKPRCTVMIAWRSIRPLNASSDATPRDGCALSRWRNECSSPTATKPSV